jgi:hypothetical protein
LLKHEEIEHHIEQVRDNLSHYVEKQIMFLLEKNHEMLMQQIGELVQKQKGIVVAQIETVLAGVPRFVREPVDPTTVISTQPVSDSRNFTPGKVRQAVEFTEAENLLPETQGTSN